MHPVSPSSLKLHVQCPALYRARYVDKVYRPESNRFLERGIRVHGLLEKELGRIMPAWDGEERVRRNAAPVLERAWRLEAMGYKMLVEHDATVAWDGGLGTWDECALRCRLDLLLFNREHRVIIDWKTGRTPGDADLQLALNALCLYPVLGPGRYETFFVYVDSGRSERYVVDVDLPEFRPDSLTRELAAESALRRTLCRLLDLWEAYERDDFPARPGDGCRWCGWRGCGR
jgi:RecB family exonuclease